MSAVVLQNEYGKVMESSLGFYFTITPRSKFSCYSVMNRFDSIEEARDFLIKNSNKNEPQKPKMWWQD